MLAHEDVKMPKGAAVEICHFMRNNIFHRYFSRILTSFLMTLEKIFSVFLLHNLGNVL